MSSEHTQDESQQRRTRRSPFVLASVAAAVLVAGGGGAYWASTASDGSPAAGGTADAKAGAGADSTPPPLGLDSGREGIAPGEPDPNGVVYRAEGKLPDGPAKASVYRPGGTVGEAEVAKLAKALGIDGPPRLEGTVWKAGITKDGGGPVLTVNQKAPGSWTFARYGSGGTDNCPKGSKCPMHTTGADTSTSSVPGIAPGEHDPTGGGSAVSEQAAKAAAAPVLKALGQDDAKLNASQLMGAVRVVNADPVIGGLPTYGWTTGVQVGPDGQVVGGSGQVKAPEKGATYPVLSAEETLKQLNGSGGGRPASKDCTGPVPLEDQPQGEPTKGRLPSDPQRKLPSDPQGNIQRQPCKQGTPSTVTVDKAVFGLSAQYVDGQQVLVPSWLFEAKPTGAAQPVTITAPALAPQYLAKPPVAPSGPGTPLPTPSGSSPVGHQALLSYAIGQDGRTLTVTFWGGICDTYAATADESGTEIRVTVGVAHHDPKKICAMIAKKETVSVTLHQTLGERQVVDANTGKALPKS
ncbi:MULTISPECIES: hypothetical protein [unclassified Streptomyces]|uniref:Large membrane protein n=1 Tax=Streptomyces sp. NBC_00060 TaxID=2975636 RepID=A0AAU2H3T2_9ACTN